MKLLLNLIFVLFVFPILGQTKPENFVINTFDSKETREILEHLRNRLNDEFSDDYDLNIKSRCCIQEDFELNEYKEGLLKLFDFAAQIQPRNVQGLFIYPIECSSKKCTIEYAFKIGGNDEFEKSQIKIRLSNKNRKILKTVESLFDQAKKSIITP